MKENELIITIDKTKQELDTDECPACKENRPLLMDLVAELVFGFEETATYTLTNHADGVFVKKTEPENDEEPQTERKI